MAENRAVAIDMLSQIGLEMSEAENGGKGLEKAQVLQLDLILMNLFRPDMAGSIVVPPKDEIEALYHLAQPGNMQDILQWANHLDALDKRYRPFANQLRVLAKGYQSKAILNFVKRYMELKEVS